MRLKQESGIKTRLPKIIQSYFPKTNFGKSILTLAGGTLFAQVFTIAASLVLTRLYTPADYGIFAVFASVLNILIVIGSLRYESAIPLPEEDDEAARLAIVALISLAVISFVVLLACILAPEWLASSLRLEVVLPYLLFIPVGLLGGGLYQILNYWAIRKREFSAISRTKIGQSLTLAGTQIGLALVFKVGPTGLLVGDVVSRFTGCGALIVMIKGQFEGRKLDLKGLWTTAKQYYKFPLVVTLSSFCNMAGIQAPLIMLAVLFEPQVAGWFMLSQRIFGLVSNVLTASVSQVYLSEASKLANHDLAELKALFRSTALKLAVGGGILATGLAISGPLLFKTVFGESWNTSGIYVMLLAPMMFAQFVVSPLSQNANIMGRHDLQLIGDSIRFILAAAAIYLAYAMGIGHFGAVSAYSIVMAISYALFFVMYDRILDHPRRLN